MRSAVTGASGVLGSAILRQELRAGDTVLGIGRVDRPESSAWRSADMRRPGDVAGALRDIDTVIHAASPGALQPRDETVFMNSVLDGAKAAGVRHVVYVSIINVDRNRGFYPYYAAKYDAEKMLELAGIQYTIQRVAQFHELADFVLAQFSKGPFAVFPPGAEFQTIDVDAAARRIVDLALAEPQRRVRDIAGPQALSMREMFALWKGVRGVRKSALTFPLPIAFANAIAGGRLINKDAETMGISWERWLQTRPTARNPYG